MRSMFLPIPILLATAPATAAPFRQDLEAGRYLKVLSETEARLAADSRDALAWAAKAQALNALLRLPEALAASEKALALKPGLGDALLARGLTRAALGIQARNLGSLRQVSAGMDDLRAAVAADPSLVQGWMSLGLGYQELPGILGGSTKQALRCAQELARIRPALGEALRGTILASDKRWGDAEGAFRQALQLGASDPQVVLAYLDALGSKETRKALGEGEQMRRLAAEGRRLLPGVSASARGVEACTGALLDGGQAEEAWKLALEALSRVDAPSLLRLHLGKIAARSGLRREEGLAQLDRVLKEPLEGGCGGYPSAHWRRGQILKDLGRKAEARAAADAALKLDPKHPGARRLREELVP